MVCNVTIKATLSELRTRESRNVAYNSRRKRVGVMCIRCGWAGRTKRTKTEAVRAWNNDERGKKNAGL